MCLFNHSYSLKIKLYKLAKIYFFMTVIILNTSLIFKISYWLLFVLKNDGTYLIGAN